jgi:K+-sensing histidine kinase KdpD
MKYQGENRVNKDNVGEVVSFGQLQADKKFKELHEDVIAVFEMLDEPALLCNPQFEVIWANIPAQRDFPKLAQRDGFANLAAFRQPDEYTLTDPLILGRAKAQLKPMLKDGELCAVAVLLKAETKKKKKNNARESQPPVIRHSKTPAALESGMRTAMQASFDALGQLIARCDALGISWPAAYAEELSMRNYQMLRIMNNYISYAKLISGEGRVSPSAVNLSAWFENLSSIVEAFAKQADIIITLSNVGEECYVRLDLAYFEIAFFNVLHNALYYTKPGGKVMVTVHIVRPHVHIIVEDSGLGIPANLLESGTIYAPHFSYAYNTPMVAAGLGLTLAREIVEAHDGTINISSEQNIGTTVNIRLNTINPKGALSLEQEAIVYERASDPFSALDIGLAGIMDKPEWM